VRSFCSQVYVNILRVYIYDATNPAVKYKDDRWKASRKETRLLNEAVLSVTAGGIYRTATVFPFQPPELSNKKSSAADL
jgi:hypothetical protein